MFPSGCSIRSAQCAALIALAAAAGISRFEPAESSPVESTNSTPSITRTAPRRPTQAFRAALLQLFGRVFHCDVLMLNAVTGTPAHEHSTTTTVSSLRASAAGLHGVGPPRPPVTLAATQPAFPRPFAVSALSVRRHVIPFAVGPPACTTDSTPRAARTPVLGDLSACRPSASKVALLFVRFVVAPSARLSRPALSLARPLPEPSLTLRGELSPLHPSSGFPAFPSSFVHATPTASTTACSLPAEAFRFAFFSS